MTGILNRLRSTRACWMPAAGAIAALSLLALYAFREVLAAGQDRLPGLDAPIFYTWEVFTREALKEGGWPHWNPYFWGGTLHFADTLTTTMYPPALLLRWLHPSAFLAWMAVLHLLIGGAGTLFLARVLGLSWLASSAAALAVTLGGGAASWLYLGHIVIVYCVAWLPWALGLAVVSVRRGTLLPHPALPLVMVVQFLAGYLQGTIYITAAVSLYYLYSAVWRDSATAAATPRWRPLVQLGVLGVLTIGLSAVQAFPLAQLAVETARTQGLPYERASAGGWTARDLATFLWPFSGIEQQPVHRYLSHRIAYVGWLLACAVPFAFLDRSRRRDVVFLSLLALAAVALAFGDNLPFYRFHYQLFPGLRLPGRILFLATLAVGVIGAIGLERIVALARGRRWASLAMGSAVTLGMVAASAAALGGAASPSGAPVHLWPWLPVMACAGLMAVAVLATRRVRLALIPALAVVAFDVTAFSAGGAGTVPMESLATIERWVGPADGGRVWSLCPGRIGSNELLLARRPSLDGPIGVTLRDFQDWLTLIGAAEWPSDSLGALRVRRDLLDHANVTTVISCEPIEGQSLTLVSDVDSTLVYRNERAWPRAVWMCGAEPLPAPSVRQRLRRGRYDEQRRLVDRKWIHVRWAPGVARDERIRVEERYNLADGFEQNGDTWRYHLSDISIDNVRALMADPAVEDTHGVDRGTGELRQDQGNEEATALPTDLLVGGVACDIAADVNVRVTDQPDGHVLAEVVADADGVMFFSEPYYVERQAFVDGKRVELWRANVAFTAVPIPAGRHVVELRLVPRSFHLGLGTTLVTLGAWIGVAHGSRFRRRPQGATPSHSDHRQATA